MTTLHFKKTFTKGNLKGITIVETLDFVNIDSVRRWMGGIDANVQAGKLPYVIVPQMLVTLP